MVLPGRIELPTSSLPRMRTTTVLRQLSLKDVPDYNRFRAGATNFLEYGGSIVYLSPNQIPIFLLRIGELEAN